MKIKIKQSKLLDLLNYLSVDGLFPFSVITISDNKLISAQPEKNGLGFRYAEFNEDFFEALEGKDEGVRIDIDAVRKFASLRNSDSTILLQYPSTKNKTMISIRGGPARDELQVTKLDKKDIITTLPFKMSEDGTPHIRKGTVPLSTHVILSKGTMKQMSEWASAHGTEFFRFKIGESGKLYLRIGDVKGVGNHSDYKPEGMVNKVDGPLDVTFTKGIKELAKTVQGDVEIRLKTKMAGWFTEESMDHKFGLLVSPLKGL